MTHKENWLEKIFDFDFPTSKYVEFLEVLRQTPTRLEALVEALPREILTRRDDQAWSIQENAGHFLAIEFLFTGRLDDYLDGAETLRPANFEDNSTDKADFNVQDIARILVEFRAEREAHLKRLEALKPEDFGRTCLHPRLNKPMRLCDSLFFQVEHDSHHLARIEELRELVRIG
ncbi:MAG: DinB family protein [Chloroflexota bacterium]